MLKEKSQKPTKKLPLKTLTLKELKQVSGGRMKSRAYNPEPVEDTGLLRHPPLGRAD